MFLLVRNRPRRFERLFRRHPCYTKLTSEHGTQQHIFLMKAYKNTLPASKNNKSCLKWFAKATFHSKLYHKLPLLLSKIATSSSIPIECFYCCSFSDLQFSAILNYCELLFIDSSVQAKLHIGRIPFFKKVQEIPSLKLPSILKV